MLVRKEHSKFFIMIEDKYLCNAKKSGETAWIFIFPKSPYDSVTMQELSEVIFKIITGAYFKTTIGNGYENIKILYFNKFKAKKWLLKYELTINNCFKEVKDIIVNIADQITI